MLESLNNQNNIDSSLIASQNKAAEANEFTTSTASALSPEDQRKVDELKAREQEVIAHEQAHRMAGGQYVRGAIQYEYETSPDNKRYIVGGEVSLDTTPVEGDPEATIQKMQVIQRAALAPQNPSPQDRKVAQEARQQESKARMESMRMGRSGNEEGEASTIASKGGDKEKGISYTQKGESSTSQQVTLQPQIDLFA